MWFGLIWHLHFQVSYIIGQLTSLLYEYVNDLVLTCYNFGVNWLDIYFYHRHVTQEVGMEEAHSMICIINTRCTNGHLT